MNVDNRKLFANRDARRRLSEMGGIMASSADLLGEAQKFQDGGRVIPGDMPPIPQQAPVSPTIGQQIGGQLRDFFQPIGDSMRETMQPMGSAIREGLEPMTYVDFLKRRQQKLPITEAQLVASADLLTPQQAADVMAMIESPNYAPTEGEAAAAMAPGVTPMETPPMNPDMPLSKFARGIGDYAAGITQTRTPEEQAALEKERAARTKAYEETTREPGSVMTEEAGDIISNKMDADAAANQSNLLASIEATATDPELPTEEKVKKTTTDVLGGIGGIPDADKMTTQDRVKAYETMFKEMLGEGDEDTQKEMWHNMAMIGFAIAAGESPRALQNIANGLLEGTKMMKQDRATRQEREDRIKMLAISEGLQDERAAAKTASAERIAALKAVGEGRDPRNPIDFWQNTYNTALTAASEGAAYDLVEGETPEQYAARKADAALSANRERFASYAPTATLGGGEEIAPVATDVTVPTITTQAEYDALPPGASFIQDGKRRKKPAA